MVGKSAIRTHLKRKTKAVDGITKNEDRKRRGWCLQCVSDHLGESTCKMMSRSRPLTIPTGKIYQ